MLTYLSLSQLGATLLSISFHLFSHWWDDKDVSAGKKKSASDSHCSKATAGWQTTEQFVPQRQQTSPTPVQIRRSNQTPGDLKISYINWKMTVPLFLRIQTQKYGILVLSILDKCEVMRSARLVEHCWVAQGGCLGKHECSFTKVSNWLSNFCWTLKKLCRVRLWNLAPFFFCCEMSYKLECGKANLSSCLRLYSTLGPWRWAGTGFLSEDGTDLKHASK